MGGIGGRVDGAGAGGPTGGLAVAMGVNGERVAGAGTGGGGSGTGSTIIGGLG